MTKLLKILFCFLLAFTSAIDALPSNSDHANKEITSPSRPSPNSNSLTNLNLYNVYSVGRSFGIYQNYGSLGIFYAPCIAPCCFNSVFDFAYHYFDDGTFGVSGGVGLRLVNSSDTLVGGLHVFYDYREGKVGDYNQIGISFELIGNCFEMRANGYVPVGTRTKKGSGKVFDDYDNTGVETPYIVKVFKKESALSGLDVEGGLKCYFGELLAYGGIGSYYFDNNSFGNLWGALARVRLEYGQIVSIQGQYTCRAF